ncbi:MAG: fused MFS/spermidine synthase, partial [Candidatus Krumholzibacteria bacterium]|nr:fused MFS/spermidine synthase [Candidatus Krumholzibacteria bacterium]
MSPAAVRRFVLPLFFLTGASSLVYQVIWLRSLAYIFGSTTYATATVLSAFMGGLALGSYLFGKIADRARRPLAVYGVLEIGIGVFALLFPLLMNVYDDFYVFLEQKTSWSFYVYSLVRFVACCLVLIVPTTLMGGTFPIISRFYVRAFSRFTSNVSLLYGLNTAGAVAGVVLAGFFLIEMFGIYRTSLLAVAVNLTVGLCAVALQGRVGATPPEEAPDAANEYELDASQPGQRRYRRVILGAVFLSGVSSLAYEVIWTRTLVFVLDSFVYSFSIMLATFLTGIAVGSFILSAIAPKIRRGHLILCVLFVLIGLTSLATFPFFAELTTWKKTFAMQLSENIGSDDPAPWGQYVLFKFLIASLIMAGPT